MLQLIGKYERDEVWKSFECKPGSKQWPSFDSEDSPFDRFTCKLCGTEFSLQMEAYSEAFDTFQERRDRALVRLAEHMNIKHPKRLDAKEAKAVVALKLFDYIQRKGENGVDIRYCKGGGWMIGDHWLQVTDAIGNSLEDTVNKLPNL